MKLTVLERVVAMQVLPAKGNVLEMRLARKARAALDFNPEEREKLAFQQEGTTLRWKTDVDGERDIPLGVECLGMVARALRVMDGKKELGEIHLSLWDKLEMDDPDDAVEDQEEKPAKPVD